MITLETFGNSELLLSTLKPRDEVVGIFHPGFFESIRYDCDITEGTEVSLWLKHSLYPQVLGILGPKRVRIKGRDHKKYELIYQVPGDLRKVMEKLRKERIKVKYLYSDKTYILR